MNTSNAHGQRERGGDPSARSSEFSDPRSGNDFDPKFYPQADGAAPPSAAPEDRNGRIKLEFCAVYYELNRLHAKLSELRLREGDSLGHGQERELMQEIEKHLRLRDKLEDQYTPHGVIAEAITRNGFTLDLKFTFGDRNILRQQRSQLVSSTALLFFSQPDDSEANENERNRKNQDDLR